METIVTIAIPITFLLMFGLERIFPARKLPKVKWWVAKGFFGFVVFGAFNAILPSIVGPAVGPHAPFHFDRLGTIGGAIAAFLLSDIVSYGVHRLLHNVP